MEIWYGFMDPRFLKTFGEVQLNHSPVKRSCRCIPILPYTAGVENIFLVFQSISIVFNKNICNSHNHISPQKHLQHIKYV